MAVGGSTTGNIQFAQDHDWLKINLTTGENYAIIVKGNAGGLPDPEIELRSPTGAALADISCRKLSVVTARNASTARACASSTVSIKKRAA